MKDFIKLIYILCLPTLLIGCSADDTVSGLPEPGDIPIRIGLVQDKQEASRATIFESPDDMKDADKGGGDFCLQAYYLEEGKSPQTYLDAQVHYFKDADVAGKPDPWRFYNGTDYYHAYWPKNGMLDFLAYMPYDASKRTYITDITYPEGGGISFQANLPNEIKVDYNDPDDGDDPTPYEFIYAYRKGMTSAPSNLDSKGRVELNFVHPFAVVYFKLTQSIRMTLHNIKFEYISCTETFSSTADTNGALSGGWSESGTRTEFTMKMKDKVIPDHISFYTVFAGPFLVIPQSINGVNMVISYTNAASENKTTTPAPIYTSSLMKWEAGKKYTYTLNLGDPGAEILFDVEVTDWEKIDYDNITNVE